MGAYPGDTVDAAECIVVPGKLSQHVIILAHSEAAILHGPDFEAGHGMLIFIVAQSSPEMAIDTPAWAATARTGDAIAPLRMAKAARTNIRRLIRWSDMIAKLWIYFLFFKMRDQTFSWLIAMAASTAACF